MGPRRARALALPALSLTSNRFPLLKPTRVLPFKALEAGLLPPQRRLILLAPLPSPAMSLFRTALMRTAPRATRIAPRLARTYAEEAPKGSSDKLTLSLVLPHEVRLFGAAAASTVLDADTLRPVQTIYKATGVTQVNIAAASGDMGILAQHVPSIESLRPGIVEVIEGQGESKKWFGESPWPDGAFDHSEGACTARSLDVETGPVFGMKRLFLTLLDILPDCTTTRV